MRASAAKTLTAQFENSSHNENGQIMDDEMGPGLLCEGL